MQNKRYKREVGTATLSERHRTGGVALLLWNRFVRITNFTYVATRHCVRVLSNDGVGF